MTDPLFARTVVPIADQSDAGATARAIVELVGADDELTVVHVIEKAGGAPDKASVEQREQHAEQIFEAFEAAFDGDASANTEILYGTDVAATILARADELDATSVAFTTRGLSGWVRWLTGDVHEELVDAAGRPVVILPNPER